MLSVLFVTAFLQGLTGSFHCAAMCGPISILLRGDKNEVSTLFIYNFSRTISYFCIGMLLGSLGQGIDKFMFRNLAYTLGSALLLLYAIGIILPLPFFKVSPRIPDNFYTWITKKFMQYKNSWKLPVIIGLFSGLLPCGLLFPAYALSMISENPLNGGLSMALFSFGTYPMMFGFQLIGGRIFQKFQNPLYKKISAFVLVLASAFLLYFRFSMVESGMDCTP